MNAVIRMRTSSLRVKAVTSGSGVGDAPQETTRRTVLSVDGRRFLLAVDADAEALEKRLIEAVRAHGDMVNFMIAGGHEVCVLVSPGVAVILEHEEVPVEDPDADDSPLVYDDVEYLS
ncbi:hypothetical protein GRS96_06770 [Rathayibacter sp. VKM Ac-2803]|uniref:hypothetical protein n=1 Tax=unclassified Rathayibacter TaxID=2609250 RepID=UPI00135A1CBC|nr:MULTISPECIES: hypothetical protein [unclassified Rathayibacter]MWV48980.1 hypothetical protein [Rathayibacter sp. VKM Ac-2803]MWV58528.1 hypothetical protein [Rathayibacter sp. VKM Ac-2754]